MTNLNHLEAIVWATIALNLAVFVLGYHIGRTQK